MVRFHAKDLKNHKVNEEIANGCQAQDGSMSETAAAVKCYSRGWAHSNQVSQVDDTRQRPKWTFQSSKLQ